MEEIKTLEKIEFKTNIKHMGIIQIKDLLIRTYIGFNPEELINKQDVVFNISIKTDLKKAIVNDDVENSYNYKTITKKIIKYVQEGKFKMLEKLCMDVLEMILENKNVKWASVEVDKPHALRFSKSVSIKLESENN
ncbi:MAG: FolB domain-containing protein [Marinifilaceae bacterium]|jgi:D-erythro-7,8-dihydroneopterin triphosphate epimerase|nr:FolB domain-containing protein [Marinifilaceae bacterium]